jgi:hypothetical protein
MLLIFLVQAKSSVLQAASDELEMKGDNTATVEERTSGDDTSPFPTLKLEDMIAWSKEVSI